MAQSSSSSNHSSHTPQKLIRRRDSSESEESLSKVKQKHSESKRKQGGSHRQRGSRSRQKDHKHRKHYSRDKAIHQDKPDREKNRSTHKSIQTHSNLHLYDHLYLLSDQNSKVSVQVGIWSSIVNYALRPKKVLVICQNQKKINKLIKASNINRKIGVIDYDSKEDIQFLVKSKDIILMTQQKSSVTLGLDQGDIQVFDMVVNAGKSYSVEYYELLPQFLGEHGIIFTVFDDKKELDRHHRKLKVNFKEFNGQMMPNDIQKEIFNQIQFSRDFNKFSTLEDLSLLKALPYSLQQTALRLFSLLKQKYQPPKSIYLKRQGHATFCLKTQTQFNSIKYVWNFIRQQMSPEIIKNIRDMKKFQNQKGVLFNVPFPDLSKWEGLQSKIQKNQKKYKGYRLYEFLNQQLPKLQDTQSQEYKILQQKKEEALKNRNKLELFMAGIPYDVNEVDIRKFFMQKQVNLFLIRVLRDSSGFSKGIAFGLAQNQENFQKAIKLNGQNFGDRQLRIKLADQRDNREK